MIERDELLAWLRLLQTPELGRGPVRRLLAVFGSPQGVIAASGEALRAAAGAKAAEALATVPDGLDALADRTLAWLGEAPRRSVVTLGDALYPASLLETADPPLILHLQGRSELLAADSLAVVGSRNPTRQGTENARDFASHLSRAGLTIVSGLALGIDGAAHEGGLLGQGSTIAVVGTGLDRVYPKRHLILAHRIADEGLIVSEYSLGAPPLGHHFPQRNRLIAGLARGTLVVEATLQSGSLITARLAAECGREVYVIPGSIHAPQSRGCHALIKQGAKLVDQAQDILEDLRPSLAPHAAARPVPDEAGPADALLQALGFDPTTLDALAERTGVAPAELSARLLELELEGRVERLPGQRFQRIERA
ncbi:MAG: DNA-protecting protein DprA [Burkholderiaceae bacterium]|nr:DNA-protecting protein DprA [Burkholderiaceae bacterium]